MPKRTGILLFSPTNTTKKVCMAIASGMEAKDLQILDMTSPETRSSIIDKPNTVTYNIDHLIVGSPVHSGKLPLKVIECLRTLYGNGKKPLQ